MSDATTRRIQRLLELLQSYYGKPPPFDPELLVVYFGLQPTAEYGAVTTLVGSKLVYDRHLLAAERLDALAYGCALHVGRHARRLSHDPRRVAHAMCGSATRLALGVDVVVGFVV